MKYFLSIILVFSIGIPLIGEASLGWNGADTASLLLSEYHPSALEPSAELKTLPDRQPVIAPLYYLSDDHSFHNLNSYFEPDRLDFNQKDFFSLNDGLIAHGCYLGGFGGIAGQGSSGMGGSGGGGSSSLADGGYSLGQGGFASSGSGMSSGGSISSDPNTNPTSSLGRSNTNGSTPIPDPPIVIPPMHHPEPETWLTLGGVLLVALIVKLRRIRQAISHPE